jgi:hypothetical protein
MSAAAISINDKQPEVLNETVGGDVTHCVSIRGPVGCDRAEFDALVAKERARYPTAEPARTCRFADGTLCHMIKVLKAKADLSVSDIEMLNELTKHFD